MDTGIPVNPQFPRGMNPPPPLGAGYPPMNPGFAPPQMGGQFGPNMMGSRQPMFPMNIQNPIEAFQKANEFSRGVYVTGFQKTVTSAMLQQHFRIKPIAGLKIPTSKFRDSKGFAFIYYKTPEDADFVKQKLDGSVILVNKIRVTKTVVAEHLSKMMFKLKRNGMNKQEVTEAKNRYFNERNLEAEVARIIHPLFNAVPGASLVEINKIVIPTSKGNKEDTLDYARGFFYISNIRDAGKIVRSQQPDNGQENPRKEAYEQVLSFIADKLNKHPDFSKYVQAEIYEYANKNRSNILHLKGIKVEPKEDPSVVGEQLKEFIQNQCKQATIKSCYAKFNTPKEAWAHVDFSTYEEAVVAYELFKNTKIRFRGQVVYANLRNIKDLRTVVISTVRDDATPEKMSQFLNRLAQSSTRVDPNDESKGRKYDFASFNILQKTTFFIDNNNQSVGLTDDKKPQQSWRENNTVPRRVVVHFFNDVKESQFRQLVADIRLLKDQFDQVFFEKDNKNIIRANHQKGHINKDKVYIKHSQLHKKTKQNQRAENRPRNPKGPRNQGEGPIYNNIARPRNPAGRGPGPQSKQPMNRPYPMPGAIPRPMGQMPAMGTNYVPKMGGIPTPNMSMPTMGGAPKSMPQMGMGMGMNMGMPVMGVNPQMGSMGGAPPVGMPMMGNIPMPQMGMTPQMGMSPQMGMPQMGAPKMGGFPPQEKKQ